jgi:hypothetical protein
MFSQTVTRDKVFNFAVNMDTICSKVNFLRKLRSNEQATKQSSLHFMLETIVIPVALSNVSDWLYCTVNQSNLPRIYNVTHYCQIHIANR